MKFLSSILGTERDRVTKRRRTLEVNLHRLEEKVFLLEMEIEETKREREKVIKELRSMIPSRLISSISMSSAEYSFNTESTNDVNDRYCGMPVHASTPIKQKNFVKPNSSKNYQQSQPSSSKSKPAKAELYRTEEEERVRWLKKQQKEEKNIEKY